MNEWNDCKDGKLAETTAFALTRIVAVGDGPGVRRIFVDLPVSVTVDPLVRHAVEWTLPVVFLPLHQQPGEVRRTTDEVACRERLGGLLRY